MDRYYYLVSQLPALDFNAVPTITPEAFLEEAEKWLPNSALRLLGQVAENGVAASSTGGQRLPGSLSGLVEFKAQLHEDVALWRQARRSGEDYRPRVFDRSAVEEGTPLEVERNLMKLEWDLLEELEAEHHFDLERLVVFLCKLLVVQRLEIFDREEGMRVFRNLCEVQE